MSNHVAVVGAGVFGAWTAHHLQRVGCRVTLIDAWGPAHSRASSGGESRLTRAAYGKDAIYTRMAAESLPQWQALSSISGLPIFIACGILFFFLPDSLGATTPAEPSGAFVECPICGGVVEQDELIDHIDLAHRPPTIPGSR